MAITVTKLTPNGLETAVFNVVSTADADLNTGFIEHGLKTQPSIFILTPLQVNAVTAGWYIDAVDDTSFRCVKKTTAASGVAGAQLQVTLTRPVTANA